jgi:hypothetical protein
MVDTWGREFIERVNDIDDGIVNLVWLWFNHPDVSFSLKI